MQRGKSKEIVEVEEKSKGGAAPGALTILYARYFAVMVNFKYQQQYTHVCKHPVTFTLSGELMSLLRKIYDLFTIFCGVSW